MSGEIHISDVEQDVASLCRPRGSGYEIPNAAIHDPRESYTANERYHRVPNLKV